MKLKRRNEHVVMYNKAQSIEMLKKDFRVKEVINEPYKLTIKTNPIKLVPEDKRHNKMIVCPIGTYTIDINQCRKHKGKESHFTEIDINRDGGTVSPFRNDNDYSTDNYHTQHIASMSTKICWGTANSEYETLKDHTDWYWMVKLCMDLICDAKLEEDESKLFYYVNIFLQLKYAIEVKNKRWENKLRKIIKKRFGRVRLEKWL